MYRLDIHYSDGRTVPVTITKDEMLIGRDASCDVVLEDAITSRHHARLTCDDDGQYWIHDLQSKNGTTIDDQGVSRARVEVGNKIGIGGCYLTLVSEPTATRIVMSDTQDEAESATTNVWDATHRIDLPQQRLEKLYELNERLTGRFDRNDLLNEVVDICVESLRFERAGVAVWRGDPHPTEWVALRNLRADPSGEFRISRSLVDRARYRRRRHAAIKGGREDEHQHRRHTEPRGHGSRRRPCAGRKRLRRGYLPCGEKREKSRAGITG